jgi:putative ABC transport system substrate-binding protein
MTQRNRRRLLVGAALAARGPSAFCQAPATPRHIGVLMVSVPETFAVPVTAFKDRLRVLGWTEGRDVEYRVAAAGGRADRLDALAAELVAWRPDLIMVGHSSSAQAVQRASTSVPIVLAGVAGALEKGFAESLARPGGQITGITNQGAAVHAKLVEFAHEIVPGARRMAFILNPDNPMRDAFWATVQGACETRNLTPVRFHANRPEQYREAGERIARADVQAIVVITDPQVLAWPKELAESLQASRLPVICGYRENVVAGGLLSYGAPLRPMFELAGDYADKLLRGALPRDLPIQQPLKFEMVLNLREARRIGVKIPQSVFLRATEVIE